MPVVRVNCEHPVMLAFDLGGAFVFATSMISMILCQILTAFLPLGTWRSGMICDFV
jgi:hypothetical protein